MPLNKVLNDAHVRIDINLGYFAPKDPEQLAKRLEMEAREVKDFLRDHRSMDINDVYVVREYVYRCQHCGYSYEGIAESPECCELAVREWADMEELIKFGYEEYLND